MREMDKQNRRIAKNSVEAKALMEDHLRK